MKAANIIFFSILGIFGVFLCAMLVQSYTYPKSTFQEMSPVAMGKFAILQDCYNMPKYYLDATPIPEEVVWAFVMEDRSKSVYIRDLKEGNEYNIYTRKALLGGFYFVECIN